MTSSLYKPLDLWQMIQLSAGAGLDLSSDSEGNLEEHGGTDEQGQQRGCAEHGSD